MWLRSLSLDQRALALALPHRIDPLRMVITFDDALPEGFPPEPEGEDAGEEGELEKVAPFVPDNPHLTGDVNDQTTGVSP